MKPRKPTTVRWELERLRGWEQNPRRHEERSVEGIARSLDTFGQQRPIVILADGTVIAGNGTLAAARSLGWRELEVVVWEGSDSAARAYAIADNRTGETGRWLFEEVAAELRELGDLVEALGWSGDELETLLAASFPAMERSETHPDGMIRVPVTHEQRDAIEEALAVVREQLEAPTLGPGPGLVKIAQASRS